MPQFVRPKDFHRYTHYRDRNPPWIKLNLFDVLDDDDYAALPDATKAHLLGLIALYARTRKPIANDPKSLARKLGAASKVRVELLAKWLEGCEQDASEALPQSRVEENRIEEKREETTIAPTRRKPPVSAEPETLWGKSVIKLDAAAWEWRGISEVQRETWKAAYPVLADDDALDAELKAALNWCLNNSAKGRKSNYGKFLSNWLARSQERGGPGRYNAVKDAPDKDGWINGAYKEGSVSDEELRKVLFPNMNGGDE